MENFTDNTQDPPITVAILTSSDGAARGEREDLSGERLRHWASEIGTVMDYCILPDDAVRLERQLWQWIQDGVHVVLTTGGTGLGPRDVMPEVTRRVVDREIPGIAEAMRQESVKHTPFGMISRGIAGVARETVIINFPGSPRAVDELWPVVKPVLPHLVDLVHGRTRH
ncbi:MAG: MogA/MoaB family molybdenum cofactor biosynthesis protein [Firmicutes bacterium]|nr:MogA/MoaB family molybdenum cofactor biosynthesis protein [Bacillota bacterium]